MTRARTIVFAVALGVAGLVAGPATPSSATTYYDYWSYWHKPPGATAWQYSKVGPSGYYLQAGKQVEGWRYAIGTASSNDPKPRPATVAYGDYCADTGKTYQVLLVVDYGTQSGAPSGPVYTCWGADTQPSGRDVLGAAKHVVRDGSDGLICAIDDYPKSGCGDVVSSPSPKATRSSSGTATSPAAAPRPQTVRTSSSSSTVRTTSPAAVRTTTAPAATTSNSPRATATVTTPAAAGSASPSDSSTIVAKQFVPPRRRGGVPFGFIAAAVFVVVLVGAVWWQRRRRAG